MTTKYHYKCPRCDATLVLQLDLPEGETPKYNPTCQNQEKHHSRRVFEMELEES